MKWTLLGILLGILAAYPQLAALATAALGAGLVWAASSPPVLAFAAGLLARPALARRMRWTA